MESIWIQLIVSVAGILIAALAAYKYAIGQGSKTEKVFLDYMQEMQNKQLEYYTQKNGHLERISKLFSQTIDKNTRALDKLSARIKENK